MSDVRVEVSESAVRLSNLEVVNRDVVDFLRPFPEEERELAVIRAIEVGVFCLQRARVGQDLDFVRRQVEGLLNSVQAAISKIPDDTHKAVAAKIGTGEGQVLAPVQALVKQVATAANERLHEVRTLLSEHIDPRQETSTLGKALRALRDLLDPKRTDSVQGRLDSAIKEVAGGGGLVAKAVKETVTECVKPLVEQVQSLEKEVRGRDAAAEALAQTTQKGATYEDQIVGIVQRWAQPIGGRVQQVGSDNRPGDIAVDLDEGSVSGRALRIVLEVRDRQAGAGRLAISDDLTAAMAERGGQAAVYVSRAHSGLAREIGEWAEGATEHGPWVACVHDHLVTALRFLVAQERLAKLRESRPSIDHSSVETQVQRVRTALLRVRTISTKVGAVRDGADAIQSEADTLRDEIRGSLNDIEDALRIGSGRAPAVTDAGETDEGRRLPVA